MGISAFHFRLLNRRLANLRSVGLNRHQTAIATNLQKEATRPHPMRVSASQWGERRLTCLPHDQRRTSTMPSLDERGSMLASAGHDECGCPRPCVEESRVFSALPLIARKSPPHSPEHNRADFGDQFRRSFAEERQFLPDQGDQATASDGGRQLVRTCRSSWLTLGSANRFRFFKCDRSPACLGEKNNADPSHFEADR